MGDGRINRHLHRARERLDKLSQRAVEQGWETSDPLLSETLTVIAHALIAQAEINQETLWMLRDMGTRVGTIGVETVRHEYRVPHSTIEYYAQQAAEREVKKHMAGRESFVEQLIRRIFGENK